MATEDELRRRYTRELGIVVCEAGWKGPLTRSTPITEIVSACGEALSTGFLAKFGAALPLDYRPVAEGTFDHLVNWLINETTIDHNPTALANPTNPDNPTDPIDPVDPVEP